MWTPTMPVAKQQVLWPGQRLVCRVPFGRRRRRRRKRTPGPTNSSHETETVRPDMGLDNNAQLIQSKRRPCLTKRRPDDDILVAVASCALLETTSHAAGYATHDPVVQPVAQARRLCSLYNQDQDAVPNACTAVHEAAHSGVRTSTLPLPLVRSFCVRVILGPSS